MNYLQKELYQLVRESADVFEFIQSGLLDGVWYWDLESPDQEWMSPQFWETLGYSPTEMKHLSSEWQDIIFADDKAIALENFQKHCEDPNHPYDQMVRYKHRDGSTVWIRCRGMAVRDSAGKPIRMLGAHINVTDLKNAELRLAEKNDELAKYSYAVSHDLKGPIGNAALAMEIIETRLGDNIGDMERRLISEVGDSMKRMVTVINDLHKIALLDGSADTSQSFSIGEIVEEIKLDLRDQFKTSGAEISLSDDQTIATNRTLFGQILYNLILNSIKYRKPDVPLQIDVVLADSRSHWTVAVADNGLGIAPKDHHKVFEFLKRLHSSHEISGTGLGLSFCKKAVSKLGGEITLNSDLDSGATFSFSIAKRHSQESQL